MHACLTVDAAALFPPGFGDDAVLECDRDGLVRVGSVHRHVENHKSTLSGFSFIIIPLPDFAAIVLGNFFERLAHQVGHEILGLAGMDLGKYIIRDDFPGNIGIRAVGGKASGQADPEQAGGEDWNYAETAAKFHKEDYFVQEALAMALMATDVSRCSGQPEACIQAAVTVVNVAYLCNGVNTHHQSDCT